ncbi:MAG: hypothetical protein Q9227_004206 [Pyrenula ochraceoflavens]
MVVGVMIASDGRMENESILRFTQVEVPTSHEVFHSPISSVSEAIGMPLRVFQVQDVTIYEKSTNPPLWWLMIRCRANLQGVYGEPADRWLVNGPQTGIVMRADGRRLHVLHLEALCNFCENVVLRAAEEAPPEQGFSNNQIHEMIRPLMNRDGFRAYYQRYIRRQGVSQNLANSTPLP